jgi:hypothetical protein
MFHRLLARRARARAAKDGRVFRLDHAGESAALLFARTSSRRCCTCRALPIRLRIISGWWDCWSADWACCMSRAGASTRKASCSPHCSIGPLVPPVMAILWYLDMHSRPARAAVRRFGLCSFLWTLLAWRAQERALRPKTA